jgi:hypothetical protein
MHNFIIWWHRKWSIIIFKELRKLQGKKLIF